MLADDAVGLDELANITDGSILIGGASNAPTEVAVTGDVTITNAGVTAIGSGKVVNAMLADDVVTTAKFADIQEGSLLTGGSGNTPYFLDASGTGKIIVGSGNGLASVAISGDLGLETNGIVTIANAAVTNAKIANATIDLTSKVTGTLPIANGGTGGSTANAALNSLGLYFGTVTFNGTSVTIDSVSGLKSSSKIFVTFSANDGNDIYVSNINTSDSEFTLTVSGGFNSTATVNWLVIIN